MPLQPDEVAATTAGQPQVTGQPQQAQRPSFYLTPQQLQMLQFLQQNHGSLTPQQQGLLAQLQHQYRAMQQHLQQQAAAQRGLRPGMPGYPMSYAAAGQPGVVKGYGVPQQPQSGTVALQTGFTDTNTGYNAAPATGNCQTAGMPYKSASDPSYRPTAQQTPQPSQIVTNQQQQFTPQQLQNHQFGHTQISSTTSCYPEGSSSNKDTNLEETARELHEIFSGKDTSSLAEDLLKHLTSEVGKDEAQQLLNNGTLSSGPFSPSNTDAENGKLKEIKVNILLNKDLSII